MAEEEGMGMGMGVGMGIGIGIVIKCEIRMEWRHSVIGPGLRWGWARKRYGESVMVGVRDDWLRCGSVV